MESTDQGKPQPSTNKETTQSTGTSTQRKNIQTSAREHKDVFEHIAYFLSLIIMIITFPISVFFCLIVMPEFQRAVIFRLGRLRSGGPRGPGLCFILPCIDSWESIDLRVASFDVPPQDILTKDSVTITVDAVVFYSIVNPLDAVIQVENVRKSTKLLAQTTLRNVAGTKMLMDLLTSKGTLSKQIGEIMDEATDAWGVKVERVEIKDVRLPLSLQRALAAEAEALREARAKVVSAEGEFNASKALKEASDIMADNSITLQLRYLQTLSAIASERDATIIFPFPIDMMNV